MSNNVELVILNVHQKVRRRRGPRLTVITVDYRRFGQTANDGIHVHVGSEFEEQRFQSRDAFVPFAHGQI